MVGSPPLNCTDIWRRGLIFSALSRISLTSSQPSSCTYPTWLASMTHGSHIMLQRLVRPLRRNRRIGIALVEELDGVKRDSSGLADNPIKRSRDLRAYLIRHKPLSSTFKNACHLTLA